MGDLDNTLVFYIWGDNGASMEPTLPALERDDLLQRGRARGRRATRAHRQVRRHRGAGRLPHRPHFAAIWAHATTRPSSGASRWRATWAERPDPMVVAWRARINAQGDLRTQFTHCIDIAPTVVELVCVPEPKVVDGMELEPIATGRENRARPRSLSTSRSSHPAVRDQLRREQPDGWSVHQSEARESSDHEACVRRVDDRMLVRRDPAPLRWA
jgi:arylsulfatase A-like enzyme